MIQLFIGVYSFKVVRALHFMLCGWCQFEAKIKCLLNCSIFLCHLLRDAAKQFFFSGPDTKRGRGRVKGGPHRKRTFVEHFFLFPTDKNTYFTLTTLQTCLIMTSVGKVLIFLAGLLQYLAKILPFLALKLLTLVAWPLLVEFLRLP